jgi:3-dehydroquinate dehydratase/shikimate dehydrogenase
MAKKGFDIIKMAVKAQSLEDNLKIFSIIKKAKSKNIKIIAFCMGEYGEISRILSPVFGGYLTFGSLRKGKESAPGQIPADILKNVYRVNDLSGDAKIYGLIGNPVKESMGYLIHNNSFKVSKLDNIYLPFLVSDLSSFIHCFREYFKGMSVTMPFKEEIIPLLDEIDATAEKIGAVNTLLMKNGKIFGCNTDCSGAVKALEERTELKNKRILMVGAGGVARAIGFGVKEKCAVLSVYDLDHSKAQALASDIGCQAINSYDRNFQCDILINCSPVGMHPHIDKTPVPKEFFKKDMIVFDAIYNPLKTRLLQEAEEVGCVAIQGVELFVNQAVDQFELWTGLSAPKNVMKEIVLERLQQ